MYSFFLVLEQLDPQLLLIFSSEKGCLLILRFLASLGEGMFLDKMLSLFVQIMG